MKDDGLIEAEKRENNPTARSIKGRKEGVIHPNKELKGKTFQAKGVTHK